MVLSRNVARGPRNGLDGPSSRLLLVLGSAPWPVSLCHDLHISVFCPLNVKGPLGSHSGTSGRFTWGNKSQVNDVDRGWRMACCGYVRNASDVQQVLFGVDDRLRRMQWMSPDRIRQSTLPSRVNALYCDGLVLEISHPSIFQLVQCLAMPSWTRHRQKGRQSENSCSLKVSTSSVALADSRSRV